MTAHDDLTDPTAALVSGARAVARAGLVTGSSGNLSVRAGDAMVITPRGARLEAIDAAACVAVGLGDGAIREPVLAGVDPSSEAPVHRAVYAATDAGAIVHTHSHFATVQSTLVGELPAVHYGITAFGGAVRVAPYATFGSEELAASVAEALRGRRAALMANHGAVVIADTVDAAVDLAVQLEWLASVSYHATLAGSPTLLNDEQLAAVAEQMRALRYRASSPQ